MQAAIHNLRAPLDDRLPRVDRRQLRSSSPFFLKVSCIDPIFHCSCHARDLWVGFARKDPVGVIAGCQTGVNIGARNDGGIRDRSDGGNEANDGE